MTPPEFNSTKSKNKAYKPTIAPPKVLVIIHPCCAIIDTTATSMMINKVKENPKESEFTGKVSKLFANDQIIQGKGNPNVMSKMFEPMEEDTAMSPNPCRATMTLDIKSGTLVPAAKNV